MPEPAQNPPITVALVDDYDVVLLGIAQMLDPYRDRVTTLPRMSVDRRRWARKAPFQRRYERG